VAIIRIGYVGVGVGVGSFSYVTSLFLSSTSCSYFLTSSSSSFLSSTSISSQLFLHKISLTRHSSQPYQVL